MCLYAREWAVSTVTLVRSRAENFRIASSFTDLLNARYNIREPGGLEAAYSIRVVVFPEPATALMRASPLDWMMVVCSVVKLVGPVDELEEELLPVVGL